MRLVGIYISDMCQKMYEEFAKFMGEDPSQKKKISFDVTNPKVVIGEYALMIEVHGRLF